LCDRGPLVITSQFVLACSVDGHPLPIDELRGTKPTEIIDLSGKGIKLASGMIIASCIAGNKHLKVLSLSLNSLNAEVGVKLVEAFAQMPNLREINLAYTNLTDGGRDMSAVTKLAEVLPSTKVEVINLARNNMGSFSHDEMSGVMKLAEVLPSSEVAVLRLRSNGLDAAAKEMFRRAASTSPLNSRGTEKRLIL